MLARIDPLDAGPRKRAAATERLCVATRTVKPTTDMIRFVVGPDGRVVADLKHKLPGRGVWVTATRQALAEAIRRKALARAFKREVRVEPDLADRVEALLERSALDALAIAHKSGAVAAGFTRVEAALQRENVAALIHAADAAPDGVAKLAAARRRAGLEAERMAVLTLFSSVQLDLALGRANVIHAALLAGSESETFLARAVRLDCFRTGPMAGLPAVGEYRIPKSAKAAGRRESM
ncbi:MAG TPA: RNA-binding protein, partial [Xanthobacteraceae bacterium]|nr:RNA-binding protein [Xanthobacteraceae bacterium]